MSVDRVNVLSCRMANNHSVNGPSDMRRVSSVYEVNFLVSHAIWGFGVIAVASRGRYDRYLVYNKHSYNIFYKAS